MAFLLSFIGTQREFGTTPQAHLTEHGKIIGEKGSQISPGKSKAVSEHMGLGALLREHLLHRHSIESQTP